jgi:hypothetical protein
MRALQSSFLNIFLPSHGSVSHAKVVGLSLDPVPGVILINEGVVVELLEHTDHAKKGGKIYQFILTITSGAVPIKS